MASLITTFKDFFKGKEKEVKPTIIKKEFNIEEFNDWFQNEFDGYDGRKGAPGIFLRTDKLSTNWIEQYLRHIGQDDSHENAQKYYDIVRKDWRSRY